MSIEKNKKIEEILGSLDGVNRAPAPDFFYTRLKARMEKEFLPVSRPVQKLRPAYAFIALFLILFVNAAVILKNNMTSTDNNSDTDISQSIAAEYKINSNLTYDINQ
jgi:hypothetical protein